MKSWIKKISPHCMLRAAFQALMSTMLLYCFIFAAANAWLSKKL